jgi:hypothetical protein
MLAFPTSFSIHNFFHISFLREYVPNANNVLDWNVIQVEPKGDFQVRLVFILDRKIKHLQNQSMELVKL